jgi:hypothetical protein
MNNNNNVDAKGWDYEHKLAYQYEREIKDCYERALDALREARDHFASAKVLGVRPDCGFEDGECIDNLQRCIEYGAMRRSDDDVAFPFEHQRQKLAAALSSGKIDEEGFKFAQDILVQLPKTE